MRRAARLTLAYNGALQRVRSGSASAWAAVPARPCASLSWHCDEASRALNLMRRVASPPLKRQIHRMRDHHIEMRAAAILEHGDLVGRSASGPGLHQIMHVALDVGLADHA
jgi:hypothetical protein